jgi:DUF4097 and DUF4098 domain-containing protein YvlB
MIKRNISWEIVLAGLTFIGIGIYMFNQSSSNQSHTSETSHAEIQKPAPPSLPEPIVIDLNNLESLKELKKLDGTQSLEELENLEFDLKNLDALIRKHTQSEQFQENLDENLKELKAELQQIDKADFEVKLQDKKVYISRDYDVKESTWTEVSPGVYLFRKSFPVSGLKSMDFNLGFGNVNIIGSTSGNGEITLRATGNIDDPATFSQQLKIDKTLASPDANFNVTTAEGGDISDHINLEATLHLPKNTKVIAHTSGGHINTSNLTNTKKLQTSGGHIRLNSIGGETIAKTEGGHITCDEISGKTSLTTKGGHIKVNKPKGTLTAQTGGGHIEIQDADGSISAKTSGGNISASIQQADGPLKFFTSAGNVTLQLPEEIRANLNLSGSSINLMDEFNFSGTKSKGQVSGTINDGGPAVVVKCEYGNINVSTYK